jgi:hypothetical protein
VGDITPDSLLVMGGARGRPTRAGVRANRRLQFRMTDQERQALKQVASELGQDVAAVMRDAVNEYVADYSERRIFRSRTVPFE